MPPRMVATCKARCKVQSFAAQKTGTTQGRAIGFNPLLVSFLTHFSLSRLFRTNIGFVERPLQEIVGKDTSWAGMEWLMATTAAGRPAVRTLTPVPTAASLSQFVCGFVAHLPF